MYMLQMGSVIRPFFSLELMVDFFKSLPWAQRTCCTLFDYSSKKYAEGKGYDFSRTLSWRNMP